MFEMSRNIENIPFSPIRKIFDKVTALKAQGKDIINLGIGEPDFDTPNHICEAMIKATKEGATHYTPNKGILELRQAICDKLLEDNELSYNPEEIICTVGVSEGIYIALSAILNPDDEVLIPDPSWLNYGHVTTINSAKPIYYPLTSENNFQINVKDLEKMVNKKTKAIVILDPSNPTGSILNYEVLEEISEFCVKNDLIVLSDEIYEKIIYDGKKHYSIAKFPGMRKRTIVLNGFAKAYAMTGWRLGYIAAPSELIAPIAKVHSYMVTSASSMVQWGGVEALRGTQQPLLDMVKEFMIRRDYVYSEINTIKGLSCKKPEGAFYIFVDVKSTGLDAESFTHYLLENAEVAAIPGTAFGNRSTHEIRISYATSLENLQKAMKRIRKACDDLNI